MDEVWYAWVSAHALIRRAIKKLNQLTMAQEVLSTPRVRSLAPPHVEADRQCLVARVLNDISTSDMARDCQTDQHKGQES